VYNDSILIDSGFVLFLIPTNEFLHARRVFRWLLNAADLAVSESEREAENTFVNGRIGFLPEGSEIRDAFFIQTHAFAQSKFQYLQTKSGETVVHMHMVVKHDAVLRAEQFVPDGKGLRFCLFSEE